MLLHINALTLFYYKIVLSVVPYKLEVIALLLLYLSQNTFYYKCYCYKGSYKGIVV